MSLKEMSTKELIVLLYVSSAGADNDDVLVVVADRLLQLDKQAMVLEVLKEGIPHLADQIDDLVAFTQDHHPRTARDLFNMTKEGDPQFQQFLDAVEEQTGISIKSEQESSVVSNNNVIDLNSWNPNGKKQ